MGIYRISISEAKGWGVEPDAPGGVVRITADAGSVWNNGSWLPVEQTVGADGTVSPGLTIRPQGRSFG
jgi:hypothetical protein